MVRIVSPSSVLRMGRSVVRRFRAKCFDDILFALSGRYRPFIVGVRLSFDRLGIPLTLVDIRQKKLVCTCDFLPDRYSWSGKPFWELPHIDFAYRYVTDPQFDYKTSNYYELAVKGRLPFPCYGKRQAEVQCRRFMNLIDQIRKQGYLAENYASISFTECKDGSLMVLNGKHRLAALIALGIYRFPAVMCFEDECKVMFYEVYRRARPRFLYRKSRRWVRNIGRAKADNQSIMEAFARQNTFLGANNHRIHAAMFDLTPFIKPNALLVNRSLHGLYDLLGMLLSIHTDFRGVSVLSVGDVGGFYALSLGRRGARPVLIDERLKYIRIVSELSQRYDLPVRIVNAKLDDALAEERAEYEIGLFLSAFDKIVHDKGFAEAENIVREVGNKCHSLFFDVGRLTIKRYFAQTTTESAESIVVRWLMNVTKYQCINYLGHIRLWTGAERLVFYGTRTES